MWSDTYPGLMEFERITIDPAKIRGVPCIRGLRIPVATVIGQLAAGRTATEILADFPDLKADDITASLSTRRRRCRNGSCRSPVRREVPRRGLRPHDPSGPFHG